MFNHCKGAHPALPQLPPSRYWQMSDGQQNLRAHSKFHSPPTLVSISLLVSLGLLQLLLDKGQLLPHCGSHLCGCRGLGAHATSQVQRLVELLPIHQVVRCLLGAALQVTIATHFAEKQQVNPLVH